MSLRHSYTLIAPLYDRVVAAATRSARARSLAWLATQPPGQVLLCGIGTGLDLPHLPEHHRYVGLDLTPAMLRRALARGSKAELAPVLGDAMRQPFPDASFDTVVLHLILAVVPDPASCLAEAVRVLRPGGSLLLFDKFLRPGQRAPLRRGLTHLSRHIATRMDVVLEPLLLGQRELEIETRSKGPMGGWFELLRLVKRGGGA